MKSKILIISMLLAGILVFLPVVGAVENQTVKAVNKAQIIEELKKMDASQMQGLIKQKRRGLETTGLLTILTTLIILVGKMIIAALPVLVQLLIIILI